MSKDYDVIIAGAGPIGLFLACELGLAKASVLVLERDLEPESLWKVEPLGRRGLNTMSSESFYRRGLLDQVVGKMDWIPIKTPGFKFAGHFAGIMFNTNKLELDRFKYRLAGPALMPGPTSIRRVETALVERAESLGVTILRGNGVTKIAAQDDHGVTVEAGENQTYRGKWLVGCDGGRSTVRKAAGFDFVGTEAKITGYAAQCDWANPEKLQPGFNHAKAGMYIVSPNSLHIMDFDGGAFDRTQGVSQEHLESVLARVSGITDMKISKVDLASAFTDRCKQATTYRKGRVLLAGDAAHIHSPIGAQGLNLGLGDAVNLGWKLAATLREESESKDIPADLSLLDTYESERHPIGEWALDWTRAQISTLEPNEQGAAIRSLVSDLIDTTDGTNLLIDRHWGLSQRYKLGEDEAHQHPLVGMSAPDLELLDGSRLGTRLQSGRGLLIDLENNPALKELIVGGKYEARVEYVGVGAKETCDLRALLVRPDGIVAWLADTDTEPNMDEAKKALEKWFKF